MNEIFGVSMRTITTVLFALFFPALLPTVWVAVRRPVLYRMGIRNVPKRKAQTVLIIVGLMLSTLIVSAALGLGDTLDRSVSADAYTTFGNVDQVVYRTGYGTDEVQDGVDPLSGAVPLPEAEARAIEERVRAVDGVDGAMPVLRVALPAINQTEGLGETGFTLVGLDPANLEPFGRIASDSLDLTGLSGNQIFLNERAAGELELEPGETFTVYVANQPVELSVAGIVDGNYLTGGGRPALFSPEQMGGVATLSQVQTTVNRPGEVTALYVSNTGGVRDTLELSDAVTRNIEAVVEPLGTRVLPVKKETVDAANLIASFFTSVFLVLGLFSIAVGVLLIILIFTMLAAERRPEMGMARAVGQRRGQLIQQFVSEGTSYALFAGVVGALLGILAAWTIVAAFRALIGEYLPLDLHITPRSLAAAFALGVFVTFLAVLGASIKVSRMNVVAAVRDIDDVRSPRRRKRTLVWAALLLLGGGLLTLSGTSSEQAFPFMAGMTMLPFGIALVLRFFGVPSRPIFTVIGLYIIAFWLMPSDWFETLFGEFKGDFEMFFLSGICMVAGATILIVQNTDLLLRLVTRLGGVFQSKLPAIRTAVAYPGAARGRTGLTIAMFSLVIFSLVTIATINQNFSALFANDDANARWDIAVVENQANPITDFRALLTQGGIPPEDLTAVGEALTVSSLEWVDFAVPATGTTNDAPLYGVDDAFLANAYLPLQRRASGYADDAAVFEALRTDPHLAVVSGVLADPSVGGTLDLGIGTGDDPFAPVELTFPDATGTMRTVTVVGIVETEVSGLFGVFVPQAGFRQLFPDATGRRWFLQVADGADLDAVTSRLEAATLSSGAQTLALQELLEEGQRINNGFLYLIQGFMGLGLIVGIAAIGVIAFRSVVERRHQIGVLRALGYQRGDVALSFLIESLFVVGLGAITGMALGLALARNLLTEGEVAEVDRFLIPYGLLTVILAGAIGAALLMTWIPSRQAAAIAPADALRYE